MLGVALLALTSALPIAAQDQLYEFRGRRVDDRLGARVGSAGDFNGDGFVDVAMAAPDADLGGTDAGQVLVRSGANGDILLLAHGEVAGDAFGIGMSGVGDINGDGFADMAIGAPANDAAGASAGRVRVFSGRDRSVLYAINGDATGDQFGAAMASAGDLNDDGFADFLVGAPQPPATTIGNGYARVYSGRDGTPLLTVAGESAGDLFGTALAWLGDVNGDAVEDFAVGAPLGGVFNQGTVFVFSGADGSELWRDQGVQLGDENGAALARAGDLNADGVADLVVGSPKVDTLAGADVGEVRVLSGVDGAVLWTWSGTAASDNFGASVGGGGDVDGDTAPDVVIGVPGSDLLALDAGLAVVLSGADGEPVCEFRGSFAGGGCGSAVAFAGNVDRDGRAEVVVGCPFEDGAAAGAGRALVFRGGPCLHLKDSPLAENVSPGSNYGWSVGRVGDLDGDGVEEFGVGAVWNDSQGFNSNGTAYIYSGADQTLIRSHDGEGDGHGFGAEVRRIGDVNGDSVQDYAVGAFHNGTLFFQGGMVRAFSGADGSVLHTVYGAARLDHLGSSIDALDYDLNGDSVPDYLCGAPEANGGRGAIMVVSGADGAIINQVSGVFINERYGSTAVVLGDVDGDGVPDFAGGGPQWLPSPSGNGQVRIHSGINGFPIRSLSGDAFDDAFGAGLSAIGDVNGDGVPDLVVGAPKGKKTGNLTGYARVISGADGTTLREETGFVDLERLGRSVSGVGDVDGDGVNDWIAGAPGARNGWVRLYSGIQPGPPLQVFVGNNPVDGLGYSCTALGDLNADGLPDFLAGAYTSRLMSQGGGAAFLFRSRPAGDPGLVETFGFGCPSSDGDLARIGVIGAPVIGQFITVTLRAAPALVPCALIADGPRTAIPLAGLGAPGCELFASPNVVIPIGTDATGRAGIAYEIPDDPLVIGGAATSQWLVVDPPANPFGAIVSDGLSTTMGGG